jgi:hypothetical protein
MGVKMGVALDSDGQEWDANSYQKGLGTLPLKCKFCSALITHNPTHTRDLDEKSILVHAYFKLLSGEHHAGDCRFAVREEVAKIVRESKDLFECIRDGEYRLRLAMIKDALVGISSMSTQNGKDGQGIAGDGAGNVYVKSSSKLPGYINSAKKVLQLRALCDDDTEIAAHLELVFEGNTVVHWAQFYFETARHFEAFNTIARNTVQHPIALHGYVNTKRIGVGKNGSSVLNLQKGLYQEDLGDPENGINAEVSIWSNDAAWLAEFEPGDEILVLGLWNTSSKVTELAEKKGRYKSFTTKRLSVNLVLMAQMAKVSKR